MVAVGSKSIPEKQSISLNLSKETEDNLNTELFSEIFSSESINNVSIPEKKSVTDNDKIGLEDANHKSENTVDINTKTLENSSISHEETESKSVKELDLEMNNETKNIIEYFGNEENSEIIKPSHKTLNIDDATPLVSTGVVLNKKSELSNEKETTEDADDNSDHNQHGNIFLNTTTALTNTASKVKNKLLRSNQENILANSDNSVSNFTDENPEENISNLVSKFKKHTPEKDSKAIIANKDTNNLSEETDSFEADEVKIVKEDYLKIKKENLVINKQTNFADNKKEIISEANTEKFFETKYLQSSNFLSPQSKNNLNNQILLNNTALEVNATSQSTNSSNGNNGNQNGTQQNSSINNYQIYNDIKETLDMSDKRWASNLVSKINRSHASKTNEIELHLSPKNLGKLKIKISVTNKTAFVKVSTDSAATSSMILNEENKLSEMLKEVGLELEDFSSENSFNQSFSNGEQGKTKNKFKPADTNNSNDINDHENYIKDESLLNIKV